MRQSYLLFSLGGSSYAVRADAVQEILQLPELTPIAEAPQGIVGIINLRGMILPVIDLSLRIGLPRRRYRPDDYVIVLRHDDLQLGMVVNAVQDVRVIPDDKIQPASITVQDGDSRSHLAVDVAMLDDALVTLVDHTALAEPVKAADTSPANMVFCPEATPEERSIFQERAQQLMRCDDTQASRDMTPVAVIELSEEYFGVELEMVREFADLQKVTAVPCCPDHIVGDMNLRGDILTVIDIRRVLQLPLKAPEPMAKTVVIQLEEGVVGVMVDRVLDIVFLRLNEMTPMPVALQSVHAEYLKGGVLHDGKMLSILALSQILTSQDLIVAEEV